MERKSITYQALAVFFLVCNHLFILLMPDKYLGVADHYYFLFLLILLALCSILKYSDFYLDKYIRLVLILLFLEVVHCARGLVDENFDKAYFLSYSVYLLSFAACLYFNFNSKNLKRWIKAYIVSAAIVSMVIMYQRLDYYGGSGNRYTIQILGHDKFDPNFLAAYLVAPVILVFAAYLFKRKKRNLILFAIIYIGLLMTSSRGAMVSSLVGIMFVFVHSMEGKGKLLCMVKIGFFAIVLVSFVICFLPKGSFNRLFVYSYMDSSNVRRFDDWGAGLKAVFQHPFLGYGYQGEMDIIKRTTGLNLIAHNTYIAFLLQMGLVGIIPYAAGIATLALTIMKMKLWAALGVLLSTLMLALLISAQVAMFLWLPIILLTCMVRCMKYRACSFEEFF